MMPRNRTILCESDHLRVEHLLEDSTSVAIADARDIKTLQARLNDARVVPDDTLPRSTVRLGSYVALIDEATNEREWFRLVDPGEADIASGKLSVLAPLGTAIFGCRSGIRIGVRAPGGTRKVRIGRVIQEDLSTHRYSRLSTRDDTITSA